MKSGNYYPNPQPVKTGKLYRMGSRFGSARRWLIQSADRPNPRMRFSLYAPIKIECLQTTESATFAEHDALTNHWVHLTRFNRCLQKINSPLPPLHGKSYQMDPLLEPGGNNPRSQQGWNAIYAQDAAASRKVIAASVLSGKILMLRLY